MGALWVRQTFVNACDKKDGNYISGQQGLRCTCANLKCSQDEIM